MRKGSRHALAGALASALLLVSPNALAQAWPRLQQANTSDVCVAALDIATRTFKSDLWHTSFLTTLAGHSGSMLVLHRQGDDISGGHALVHDPQIFDELPDGPASDYYGQRYIYWQHKAQDGQRLVAVESAHSWRGDVYGVVAIPESVSAQAFLAMRDGGRYQKGGGYTTINEQDWQPPLFLLDGASGKVWSIDTGHPWEFLTDWNVFSTGADGFVQRCVVEFRPAAEAAADLMPPPVRDLMLSIDGTLGDGRNDGTLSQTTRLRKFAATVWANAALRPWAVKEEKGIASRSTVDNGLKEWSLGARSFRKLYDEIILQYPRAETALASHYVSQLGMDEGRAASTAKKVLDIAFRSNFQF